ncbi:expressed unknown protein [Seminavis robusta]|uniref:Uncharacterized protein n=1 Tax=Seminavis robusta TaxID=568900 RepID=A0A9N8HC04_9STRA|nr:expressed unknown protein [Seminavis robusta]|eukprot:Sro387_g132020.1 n/a (152) ;mRNA; f:12697-13152
MSGLSSRSLYGTGRTTSSSSSSTSSTPPGTGSLSPPSPSVSMSLVPRASIVSIASSSSMVLAQRRSSHVGRDAVTKAATKLNELMSHGGIFFSCGSPRVGQDDELLLEEIASMRTGRQRSLLDAGDSNDGGGGIEVDSENSLRPAYELYRV